MEVSLCFNGWRIDGNEQSMRDIIDVLEDYTEENVPLFYEHEE
jgi:hypothetical protein